MSGVRVEGGSMSLLVFCSIRYMARENCSRFSLPVCLVSASPLQGRNKPSSKLSVGSNFSNTIFWEKMATPLWCKLIAKENLVVKRPEFSE